jgi:hypothetical protein
MAVPKPGFIEDNDNRYTKPIVKNPPVAQPGNPNNPVVGGPVYTPMSKPTVQNDSNTSDPSISPALNAYRNEEIRRKAESGEALQVSTTEKQQLYDQYKSHYENLTKQKAQTGQALTNPNAWKQGVYQNELNNVYTNEVNNEIQKQIEAYNNQLARSQQANQLAVSDNNAYLQEQLQSFQKQKNVTDNQSQMLANRRGGFYSGGLDYQLGQNAASFNEQTGALQRDIGRRNADIYGRNALMAEEASKQISLLQQQAPDLIRQRVQAQLDKLYNRSVTEAGLTGKFNGQNTMDLNSLLFNQGMQVADLTGMYNGAPTLQNQQWQQQFGLQQQQFGLQKQGQQFDQQFQQQQFAYQRLRDSIEDKRWQAQFDQDVQQFGLNYALQHQIQSGNLSIDQARLALSQQEFGLAQDKFTFDQQLAQQESQQQPSANLNSYTGQLNKTYLTKDDDGNLVLDPKKEDSLINAIIGLNLSDADTDRLLSMYGLLDKVEGFLQR